MTRFVVLLMCVVTLGGLVVEPSIIRAQGPSVGVQMDKTWAVRWDLSDKSETLVSCGVAFTE